MKLGKLSTDFWAVVMVVAAGFAAAGFDAWRVSRPDEVDTFIPREVVITPEIRLLQEYIRIDTSNPPGNEIEAARWLARQLEDVGIESEIIESVPGRANVYARLEGRSRGEGLLLLHHMDVVPAPHPEHWTKPPFGAEIRTNELWGRGALDMKAIGVCHLLAFIDVAKSGRQPERDIVFLATADEETGGKWGVEWLLDNRPEFFEGIRYALNEGGITETLQEKVTYFGVELGTRQVVRLRMTGERRAVEKARTALFPLGNPEDPLRVIPEVAEVLRQIGEHRIQGREELRDVNKTIANGDFWKLHPTYRALMQNGVVVGGLEPSKDGKWQAPIVLQNLPDQEPDETIELIRRTLEGMAVEIEVIGKQGPTPITSADTPFFERITREARIQYGEVDVGPQIQQFVSNDSRFLRVRGIDAYGIWPFPVTLFQTFGIHKLDERITLDWFVDGVNLTRRLVDGYAFDESL